MISPGVGSGFMDVLTRDWQVGLIFQTRSSGDRPVNSTIRGRLATSTTIQFERETNEGTPRSAARS